MVNAEEVLSSSIYLSRVRARSPSLFLFLAFLLAYANGNAWDIEGADWAKNDSIFGQIGDVVCASEAAVTHDRICMVTATDA
jgi:hypothetical protein